MSDPQPKVDPGRRHLEGATGVYVRALQDDRWVPADIACLTLESAAELLASKSTAWLVSLCLSLLAYPPLADHPPGEDT